jgi:hypothetical protein
MSSPAFALYRRRFFAIVVTAAFAIVPASLLEGGALKAGVSRLYFDAGPSPQKPSSGALQTRLHVPSMEPAHPLEAIRAVLPFLYETFLGVLLLAAGAWLALAAVTPFTGAAEVSPTEAWAKALHRLGALFGTALLAGLLIALGSVFFVIPGIVVAVGLAFAVPVVMAEGLSGSAALHRSWALVKPHWPQVLLLLLALAVASGVASLLGMLSGDGPQRLIVAAGVRMLAWPLPLLALAAVYRRATSS